MSSSILSPSFFRPGLSLSLEFSSVPRLAASMSPRDPPVSASPVLGFQTHTSTSGFLRIVDVGDRFRSSCLYGEYSLTEPFPQLQVKVLKTNSKKDISKQ